jgi:hypothetical protein
MDIKKFHDRADGAQSVIHKATTAGHFIPGREMDKVPDDQEIDDEN